MRLLATLSVIALPGAALGQEEVRFGADASANVGYSTNPFSEPTDDTGSAFGEIQISPRLRLVNSRSIFTLSGIGLYQQYLRHYGHSSSYGGGLDYAGTPSKNVKSHLYLRYDSSILGGNNLASEATDPALPIVPVLYGNDISLFGTRTRLQTLRGGGDVTVALSARDQITASTFYSQSRYGRFGGLGNYDAYGGSLGFARRVTERLQLGAQSSVARYDYTGLGSSTTVLSPQISFSAILGPRWKADGAVGASFVDNGTGGTRTSLSGDVRLCRATFRSNFCLSAQRAVLPTGISGTQNATSADANYSYKVSERDTLRAAAGYTSNANSQLLIGSQNQYLRASLGYEHVLRERLRFIASTQYRKIFGGIISRRADFGGRVGIAVRLGDLR